jgi:hypothetical protein
MRKEDSVGEIRSTIDLIMERTRGMTLSEKEKEEFHKEELHKKAKGLRVRLTEHRSEVPEVLTEIEAEPEPDRDALRSLLWRELVEGLPGNKSAAEHIEILEQFPQATAHAGLFAKIRSFVKTGAKTLAADRKKALVHERKRLETMGIAGTAVVPRLPESADLEAEFNAAIARFKRELLAASDA